MSENIKGIRMASKDPGIIDVGMDVGVEQFLLISFSLLLVGV